MLRPVPCSVRVSRNGIEALENRIAPATVLAGTENNRLLRFDHLTPAVIDTAPTVAGLGVGDTLMGTDFDLFTGVMPESANIIAGGHRYSTAYHGGSVNDVALMQILEPAVSKNGRSVQFTDVDGDLVTVTVSKGKLEPWRLVLNPTEYTGRFEFEQLDLSTEAGKMFHNANVTIKATPQDLDGDGVKEGDGFVRLGQLQATGVNLRTVSVDGNLGGILAGDTSVKNAAHKLSVKNLQVLNLGQLDLFSSDFSDFSESVIQGNVGKIGIKQDLAGVSLEVTGNVSTLAIGGSIVGGSEQWSGRFLGHLSVDKIRLGGGVLGGSGADSGTLITSGWVSSLEIKGAIEGGSGRDSGSLDLGALVKGHVEQGVHGGTGRDSGLLKAGSIIKLAVDGPVQGGDGDFSGSIQAGNRGAALISGIGSLKISGGLYAGPGEESGSVVANGAIEDIRITGSVTGAILAERGTLIRATITGDVTGTEVRPARISGLLIGAVTIGGSVSFGEITTPFWMTSLNVAGSLYESTVIATGATNPDTIEKAMAIGVVTIGGNMEKSQILAGYDLTTPWKNNADSGIGAVVISGNFISSDVVAGIYPGNEYYGDQDDRVLDVYNLSPVLARIASIKVLGQMYGTAATGDSFGIVAEQIDSVEIGQSVLRPALGEWFTLGATQDVVVREV